MYFILSYRFSNENHNEKNKEVGEIIKVDIRNFFQNYTQLFEGLFVIECAEEQKRKAFSDKLMETVKNYGSLRFVLTPLIGNSGLKAFFETEKFDELKNVIKNKDSSIYGGGISFKL